MNPRKFIYTSFDHEENSNMTTTINATPLTLTPDLIRAMICESTDSGLSNSWAFRSLLLLVRYMEHDLSGYRKAVGKVENRNSPRYWIDWMSRSLVNRTMKVSDCAGHNPQIFTDPTWFQTCPGRSLSGTHLISMKNFFQESSVVQTVYDLATGKIALPPLFVN